MSAVDIAAIREDIAMAARSGEMARHVALDHGTELCDEIEKLRAQVAGVRDLAEQLADAPMVGYDTGEQWRNDTERGIAAQLHDLLAASSQGAHDEH